MAQDEEKSAFASRLEHEMAKAGISDRAELGRMTGIPYHRLNPWFIRPKAKPNAADLLAVARALDVSQDYLLHGGERRRFSRLAELVRRVEALDATAQDDLESYLEFLETRATRSRSDAEQ